MKKLFFSAALAIVASSVLTSAAMAQTNTCGPASKSGCTGGGSYNFCDALKAKGVSGYWLVYFGCAL